MKKLILIGLILILLFSLTACNEDTTTDEYALKTITSLQSNILDYVLTITTQTKLGTLTSQYEVTNKENGKEISYSYQQFATIDINNINAQVSNVITKQGKVIVANGQITSTIGDEINSMPNAPKFVFGKECLQNIVTQEGVFSADITNFQAFCGKSISVTNAKVAVEYTQSAIISVIIAFDEGETSSRIEYAII